MDMRAAKLALARKKLKDHQEKKSGTTQKPIVIDTIDANLSKENNTLSESGIIVNAQAECLGALDSINNTTKKPDQVETNGVDINVTEILISNKRNLEEQVSGLESKLRELESAYRAEINNHNCAKQQVTFLQNELKDFMEKYGIAMESKLRMDKNVEELNKIKTSLFDDNNNLKEQLEFTKSILTAKETENTCLHNQMNNLQNELDFTKLQLQQLTSGSNIYMAQNDAKSENSEELLQKIHNLEELLKTAHQERDQVNTHYEQYVRELNEELKSAMIKNEEFSKEISSLSIRESSLIEQISEMEIRLQSFKIKKDETIVNTTVNNDELINLQNKYTKTQNELEDLIRKYEELSALYTASENRVHELQEELNSNSSHDNISISKLTADIASDKIAAQRATEQNKKLKSSIQELEESFVKMSQDKLELTEKLTAEKYLNRELTIKLAEIEEKSKDLFTKLRAKDEEMIRLQMSFRALEKELENKCAHDKISSCEVLDQEHISIEKNTLLEANVESNTMSDNTNNNKCLKDCTQKENIPKEDAMLKLQERFMKIMGEVADLSDEKHRLEHIILQLQNETDTICEYVALYQQQRSLLKKRDEERNAQIKLFQIECDRLKSQLEELSRIIIKFAEDKELSTYFQVEHRKNDMERIRSLLVNLKNSTLVDPKTSLALNNVYPCNCCSGNLIDV